MKVAPINCLNAISEHSQTCDSKNCKSLKYSESLSWFILQCKYLRKVVCSSFVMCMLLTLPLRKAFLQQPPTVLTRQTRQSVHAISHSIFLRSLWLVVTASCLGQKNCFQFFSFFWKCLLQCLYINKITGALSVKLDHFITL